MRHAPIATFGLDPEGRYLLCRGHALEHIGIRQDEAVGHSIFERHPHASGRHAGSALGA